MTVPVRQALIPNQVTTITIDLHTQSYRYLKGHRVWCTPSQASRVDVRVVP
jgi:predicted acyl esterase